MSRRERPDREPRRAASTANQEPEGAVGPAVKNSLPSPGRQRGDPQDAPFLVFDLGCVVMLLCALVVVVPPLDHTLPGNLRLLVVLAAAVIAPGAAVLTRTRAAVPQTVIALSLALSLAIDSLLSSALAWANWWYPDVLGAVVAGVSGALLLVDVRVRRSRLRAPSARADRSAVDRRRAVDWLPTPPRSAATIGLAALPLVALALWAVSLTQTDISDLGQYGLVPALRPLWLIALALAVLGTCAALQARVPRALLIGAGVGVTALILFGTIPALSDYPQYAWTYKHVGVTRFIEDHGGINPAVDIYNRWPGFFAPAAVITAIAGVSDPVGYAGWSEVFFTWIDTVIAAAVVWSVTRSTRVAGGAALLFVILNWVGQNYYSPQAFAFALALGCSLLLTAGLATRDRGAGERTLRFVRALTRTKRDGIRMPPALAPAAPAMTLILLLFASIVVSHQLSPYVVIAQVAVLGLLRLIRPRWLAAVMAVMAIAYVIPNYEFLRDHFGFLSSFDPLGNALASTAPTTNPVAGKIFNVRAALVLSGAMSLAAVLAYARLTRQGLSRRALPFAVLALAPYGILLGGQGFGGESSLRAIMFSTPWCAALIAWAIATLKVRSRRFLVLAGTASAFAALFLPSFYGQAELNIMPAGEAQASEYLYTHAAPGALVMVSGIEFPAMSSNIHISGSNNVECLNCLPQFTGRRLGTRDIPAIVATMKAYSPRGYLIFSHSEQLHEEIFRTAPSGSLETLERAVAASNSFTLWHATGDTRIYELRLRPTVSLPAGSPATPPVQPLRPNARPVKIHGGRSDPLPPARGSKARPVRHHLAPPSPPMNRQPGQSRTIALTHTSPPAPPAPAKHVLKPKPKPKPEPQPEPQPKPKPKPKPTPTPKPKPKPIKVVVLPPEPPAPPVEVLPPSAPPSSPSTDPSDPSSTSGP